MELSLALPLLVPSVGTDDTDDPFAANNLAILAKLLNRCADFHNLKSLAFLKRCGLATNRKATIPA